MNKVIFWVSRVFCAVLMFVGPVFAVPSVINYQGQLTDANGPVNGTRSMAFTIYADGVQRWTETQNVSVQDGIYNVLLGTMNPLDEIVFAGTGVFELEVSVEGVALSPRQQLASVTFSFRAAFAERADRVSDGGVTDSMITGFISAAKIEQGDGSTLDADTLDGKHAAALQSRVTGTCPAGRGIGTVNEDGSVVCVPIGQIGTITNSYVPRSDGSGLVTGSIFDNGNVGIGTDSPAAKLDVSTAPVDVYGSWIPYNAYYNPCEHCTDSCPGGNHQTEFACISGQPLSCEDLRNSDGEDWEYRTVSCNQVQTAAQFSGNVRVSGGTFIGDGSGLTHISFCQDGDFVNCYQGAIQTINVAPCVAGRRFCSNRSYGACVGQVLPATETCNSVDDDCNGTIDDALPNASGCTQYYPDSDGDGYGNMNSSGTCLCIPPGGYVTNHTDCRDIDSLVNPTAGWHTTPIAGTASGWDYNCNGQINRQYTAIYGCSSNYGVCSGEGWVGSMPDCGVSGTYKQCSPSCTENQFARTQACR